MIELKNVKKYYKMGDSVVKALDDVSLKINDGEFVTIIGPSGSGKSTMMNIIGCLDTATEGNYYVDGVEISKYTENQLAYLRNKKMGFIFQGFNLLQNLTAFENVELPLIYQGVSVSERKERAIHALELVGMKERMKHRPGELSGGQQQRVAIARALATKPMCILADEPTGNLDSATGDEIMKILRELNELGTTIVIITHNDEIAKQSRRVVRIHDGKLESDTINENIPKPPHILENVTETDPELKVSGRQKRRSKKIAEATPFGSNENSKAANTNKAGTNPNGSKTEDSNETGTSSDSAETESAASEVEAKSAKQRTKKPKKEAD